MAVCADAPGPVRNCSQGYTQLGAACYAFVPAANTTYLQAVAMCERNGGDLASIASQHVSNFILQGYVAHSDHWRGFTER